MFIFIVIVFFFSVWMMNRVYLGVQPGKSMIQSDIKKYRTKSQKHLEDLVEWKNEELSLLSFNYESLVRKKGFGRSEEGVFKSKYHEKMFYFAMKEYIATSKRYIFYARTKKHELLYQVRKGNTQVYINADYAGTIATSGEFFHEKNRKYFGKVVRTQKVRTQIFDNEGDLLGSIVVPDDWNTINPGATDMEKKLDESELLVFKILSIYDIILIFIAQNNKSK